MTQWFKRFADIPGVGYDGTRTRRLPGQNSVPERHVSEMDGKRYESLSWPVLAGDGTTSASPASQHRTDDSSTAGLLQHLSEVLELPGTGADYHFAIQGVADDLWERRREEPGCLQEVERLCWLDIRLAEALPEAVSYEREGVVYYYGILSLSHLIRLYLLEGYLWDALKVAKSAERLGQGSQDREDIEARLRQLESEDAR